MPQVETQVVIIDNVSMLRHNNFRVVGRNDDRTIQHRNFQRKMNSKEKKEKISVIEEVMEEE